MAQERSFQEMLHQERDIHCTENVPATAIPLSTLKPTDTLVTTYKKMDRLAACQRRQKCCP
ncbi:uncharacterized protein N7525_002314 [Penicillium rubens]|uniref:uncharacterized protein n=1 Tax=Penicillium rubens TaxID=1108849 RepID=UPI00239BF3DD|nr:uncharacterized protein N7525_002314 [Penicillium rubens]KAJ5278431.1 hypothetical protein N7524_004584 [Penicillium chrysogenum]KAJ5844573.1 hypothetical protein N7525_002314 [Penicillium rubens]